MYTDEDLNIAVKNEIFSSDDVQSFRNFIAENNHSPSVDEENIKLVGSFNDIFVVIACCLLLFSSLFALQTIDIIIAKVCFVAIAWGLAEFFVLKRKMAFPAIVLLGTFVWGIFTLVLSFFPEQSHVGLFVSALITTVVTYLHWLRFNVPITVAAGTAALACVIIAGVLSVFPEATHLILPLAFLCGLASFTFAMYWDTSDKQRVTNKSDVAFWLHLISAPLIIHPIFSSLNVLGGNESIAAIITVIVLYGLMTLVSLIIDRRAFMVSSLIYVVYAFTSIFELLGNIGNSLALTGVLIGAALLLLSASWHIARGVIVSNLPAKIQQYVPMTNKQ